MFTKETNNETSSHYYPVIRLGSDQAGSYEDYKQILESKLKEETELGKANIEFTFGSPGIEENFAQLIKDFGEKLNICIGTVIQQEEAELVKEWGELYEATHKQKLMAFSPHFDTKLIDFFAGTNVIFIPAVRTIKEFQDLVEDKPSYAKLEYLKVFPYSSESPDDLLKALRGPYRELETFKRRITTYDHSNEQTIEINSPNQYSQAREEFINSSKELVVKKPDSSALETIEYIRSKAPELKLIATGLGKDIEQEELDRLLELGLLGLGGSRFAEPKAESQERKKNFFNIVLHNPEIPQNTGNIARMCVANDLKLHLVKPMGFEIQDKYLKRAALDYWKFLDIEIHESWDEFLKSKDKDNPKAKTWLLTTKSDKSIWDTEFKTGDYLVFGAETRGLPSEILEANPEQAITIPMSSDKSRSLNLASSVQTAYYEAYRQNR